MMTMIPPDSVAKPSPCIPCIDPFAYQVPTPFVLSGPTHHFMCLGTPFPWRMAQGSRVLAIGKHLHVLLLDGV